MANIPRAPLSTMALTNKDDDPFSETIKDTHAEISSMQGLIQHLAGALDYTTVKLVYNVYSEHPQCESCH